MNQRESRNIRIKNDYYELMSISCNMLEICPVLGKPPFVTEYKITIRANSILGVVRNNPIYRKIHEVKLVLGESYPISAPFVQMISMPQPYHPNWFVNGTWCGGLWLPKESISSYVYRMAKTIQFSPSFTNPSSAANSEAAAWYLKNRFNKDLIPCDHNEIPTLGEIKPIYIVNISQQ